MGIRLDRNIIVLTLGIATILIAMAIVVTVSLDRMHSNIERMDAVVHVQNTKIALVTRMVHSARERTLIMLRMLVSDDPFDRDDLMLNFNSQGAIFVRARMELLSMDLSKREKELLDEQGSLSNENVPLQREIVDLIIEDNHNKKISPLLDIATPNQDSILDKLSSLLVIQQESADKALKEASLEYQATTITMALLAASVFIICVLIAFYVVKHTTQARRLLFQEKERAQITLHSIGDGVITTNADGIVEHLNTIAEYLTGWENRMAQGMPNVDVCKIRTDSNHENHLDPIAEVLNDRRVISSKGNAILLGKDNNEFAIEYTASPIFDKAGSIKGTILVFKNVTEMRTLNNELAYQAKHDALTKLINRAEFELSVELLINDVRQTEHQHVLCYLDIDQFKVVNDTCGHFAGDELIKQLAETLRSRTRESDIVGRLGGDEFGILFKECSMEKAKELMESIREFVHGSHFSWEDKSFNIGISAGLVAINSHSKSLYDLLSAADSACYVAKDEGRNRIHVYQEEDASMAGRMGEMQWVHRITKALDENRFRLYHHTIQPLHDIDETQQSCEILVRLEDEEGKIVPPMAFIPAAERYNLMGELDKWIIKNVLDLIDRNLEFVNKSNFNFSINISAQSLGNDSFLEYIQELFSNSKVSPSIICFEITETTAIANLLKAQNFISTLKTVGCKFALDDFGSGLSSFAYLKNLHVDFLKIDGAFVRDVSTDEIDRAMVNSINQVGHLMGLKTIAEYVETEAIYEIVKDTGVDFAQGHFIGMPEPIETLLKKSI